jgi:hypothetical protein
MKRNPTEANGLNNLITIYRKAFQLPENLNHYSEHDFKQAERQFIKFMLHTRGLSNATPQRPVPL